MDNKPDINLLYKRLCDSIKSEADEETLRFSEQILAETPQDNDISLCKALALLRLSKYEAGLSFIQGLKSKDPTIIYCFAYCYYKLGQYSKSLETISKSLKENISHAGFQLLEAQILYKQEKYDDSFRIYQAILDKIQPNEENYEDLLVNLLCSSFYCDKSPQEKALQRADGIVSKKKEFLRELLFNMALVMRKLGAYDSSLKTLQRFKALVDEETDQQQRFNDSLLYTLEKHYIDSAYFAYSPEVYDDIVKNCQPFCEKPIDEDLKIILLNNMVFFKSQSKSFHGHYHDDLKTLDSLLQQKPQKFQEILLMTNKILLAVSKNKLVEAQKMISELENKHSKEDLKKNTRFLTAKFFLLYKSKNFKALESLINELLESKDKSIRTISHFIKAEISRLQHKYTETLTNLKGLVQENPEFLNNEAFGLMFCSLAAKCEGEISNIVNLISDLANKSYSTEVQVHCADLLLKREAMTQAASIYEKILEKRQDPLLNMKLLQCYMAFDSQKAETLLHKVPLPQLIVEEKEIKRLLDKDTGFLNKAKQPGSPRSPKDIQLVPGKKTIKKKRKPRYPKGFDPKNPGPLPDAERWLPLYERSKFKKLKGKKAGGRGAQGEVGGKETVNTFKSGSSTANQEVSTKKTAKNKKKRK